MDYLFAFLDTNFKIIHSSDSHANHNRCYSFVSMETFFFSFIFKMNGIFFSLPIACPHWMAVNKQLTFSQTYKEKKQHQLHVDQLNEHSFRMHTHSDRHDLEIFRCFTMKSVILAVKELKNIFSVENNSDALKEINNCMSKVQSI